MIPFLAMAGLSIIQAGLKVDAAKAQADRQRLQTMEEWRRLRRRQLTTEGQAAVTGAASGVDAQSEGLQAVLADMSAEHTRQADWLKDAGMEAANATDKAAVAGFIGDMGKTFFSLGSNMKWFG